MFENSIWRAIVCGIFQAVPHNNALLRCISVLHIIMRHWLEHSHSQPIDSLHIKWSKRSIDITLRAADDFDIIAISTQLHRCGFGGLGFVGGAGSISDSSASGCVRGLGISDTTHRDTRCGLMTALCLGQGSIILRSSTYAWHAIEPRDTPAARPPPHAR